VANKRKTRQYTTLISVLACGSTPEARRLIKSTTGQDAVSEADLEDKLARLYAESSSKLDLEKTFAEIHPHKDFILKYCTPPSPEPLDLAKLNIGNTEVVKQVEIVTQPTISETENPTQGRSCACGYCSGFSNADGQFQPPFGAGMGGHNMTILVLGLVSIVAIAGTIMYLKSSKN